MATDTRVIRRTLPCGCSWGAFKPATYCERGLDIVDRLAYAASGQGRYFDEWGEDFVLALAEWRAHFGPRRTPEYCRRHRA